MNLETARLFLDWIWGDDEGYVHLADKPAVPAEPEGREGFRPFCMEWPRQRPEVWAWLRDVVDTHATFWNPVVREGTSHSSDPAAGGYRLLWAEADKKGLILSSSTWAPWKVLSGSDDHAHLYQELAGGLVSARDWEWQASRLGPAWWGTDAKPDRARFVRIPGTWHRKIENAHTARARRAVRLVGSKGSPIDWATVRTTVGEYGVQPPPRRAISRTRPAEGVTGHIRRLLDTDDPPRAHRLIWKIARTLLEEGRTEAEVLDILDGSPVHEAKLTDNAAYNLAQHIGRAVAHG